MNPLPIELAAGLCLGALGALGHLAVVAWRVSLAVSGRPECARRAHRAWPLGLLGPGAAVLAAAWWAAPAAWAALAGLVLTRWCVLDRSLLAGAGGRA